MMIGGLQHVDIGLRKVTRVLKGLASNFVARLTLITFETASRLFEFLFVVV